MYPRPAAIMICARLEWRRSAPYPSQPAVHVTTLGFAADGAGGNFTRDKHLDVIVRSIR
jgi:hypothetical protein